MSIEQSACPLIKTNKQQCNQVKKRYFLILKSGISIWQSGLQASVASKAANGRCLSTPMGLDTICQALVLKTQLGSEHWRSSTQTLEAPAAQVDLCPWGVPRLHSGLSPCMQMQCPGQHKPRQPSHLFHQAVEEGFKFRCFCPLGESCALQSWWHRWRRRSAGRTGMKSCLYTVELTKPLLFSSVK